MKSILITAAILLVIPLAAFGQTKSVYTSLSSKDCKASQDEALGENYMGLCPGFNGYALELLEGDLRQTVNVIAPNKKKYELDLWSKVSGKFSSVGEKAEWRVKGKKPVALILRFNANESVEDNVKNVSYLVVTKITANEACVVDIIKPSKNQNMLAQKSADKASALQCRTQPLNG
jgi:hypothetical protein